LEACRPVAAWAHVALTLAGGKATLFVNGAAAATADVATPALDAPLALGAGLAGLVDELQVVAGARGADWVRLTAAAQGADGKLVASVKESADSTEGAGENHGYLGILVKNLTVDAWVVIIILGIMFVVAAWVMVTKTMMIGRTDRDNRSFLQRFRDARGDLLQLDKGAAHPHSSLYRLYQAGLRELRKRDVGKDEQAGSRLLSGASLDAVKASVDADLVRENHKLNAQMVLLTIAISGGPFLGLLGTVVGVMITFAAIAAAGDVNVNAIAPGIAAALLATVAGLGVAIPALFAYNWLASRIKNISADMQIFVDEFVTRVAETYGQR
jgi:biopolymer transport protein ExbB